jgi:chorismate mutase/prephenate dehydrogenase
MVAELTALRDQIDEVDKALLDLLARRMALVAEVGEVKAIRPADLCTGA